MLSVLNIPFVLRASFNNVPAILSPTELDWLGRQLKVIAESYFHGWPTHTEDQPLPCLSDPSARKNPVSSRHRHRFQQGVDLLIDTLPLRVDRVTMQLYPDPRKRQASMWWRFVLCPVIKDLRPLRPMPDHDWPIKLVLRPPYGAERRAMMTTHTHIMRAEADTIRAIA
jgi:hypothetical protein